MSKLAAIFLLIFVSVPSLADTITIPAPECSAVITHDDKGFYITAPGYSTLASPGNPELPYKELNILLPASADPASISVALKNSTTIRLKGTYNLRPAPPFKTSLSNEPVIDWGEGKQIESARNVLVYRRNDFFPAANVELIGCGRLRQWQIAGIRYYPYQYNPVTSQIRLIKSGDIELNYNCAPVTSATLFPDETFSEKLPELVVNDDSRPAWYPSPASASGPAQPSQASGTLLILTTNAIVSGSAKLQDYISGKTRFGFKVLVATESAWGGGTGDIAADNIRSYLKANYSAKAIRYVLLIGNPNPVTGDVPMKMLWPRRSATTYREAPSDYYYADLTGNWDLDRDGYYGEYPDDFGIAGVDRYPEVIVGRIPFYGSFADLDSILAKTINYEAGVIGEPWTKNVLLSMEPSDVDTPGYHLGEAIKGSTLEPAGFNCTRVYQETYGLTPQPEYTPCDYNNVLAAWQKRAGFHFWWTHGSDTMAADIMTSDRCQYLDDNSPSFTFQVSCSNGTPENPANLGYSLLRQGAISTISATRVSWYAPGQTTFANSDTNAGLAYTYANKLIKAHEPCGDAFYDMMIAVPNAIWMNHCVFNLYGDPSIAYPTDPVLTSTPLPDTDNATSPYVVTASAAALGPFLPGYPCIKWSTDHTGVFETAPMTLTSGTTYSGLIPPQYYGTSVYYYIIAQDAPGRATVCPSGAPATLYTFKIAQDVQPPSISHTPLSDTHDITGPYIIKANIKDSNGIKDAALIYSINGGAQVRVPMASQSSDLYQAQIPGPMNLGDSIDYYLTASDDSSESNMARSPASPGNYTFKIGARRNVAVYNSSSVPPYFIGGNSNSHSQVAAILNSDPASRFQVITVTSLSPAALTGQDALVLPDNAVQTADLQAVSDWFTPGKIILSLDSAACYGAYSGWMWPGAIGTSGYSTCWDYNSGLNDQQIWVQALPVADYTPGQIIESRQYETQYRLDKLPADAVALTGKPDRSYCYCAYRDVPGNGRFALLGPCTPPAPNQYALIRNILYPGASKSIRITAPSGTEVFDAGAVLTISYQPIGMWAPSETIKLEYNTGLDDSWRPIPGTEAPPVSTGSYSWNTTGLPGSRSYRIRASSLDGAITSLNPGEFSIIPTANISQAKFTPDNQYIRLEHKSVIYALPDIYYVEEPDKSAGIKLRSAQGITPAASVTVTGKMNTLNGERVVDVDTVEANTNSLDLILPLAMNTSEIGGGPFGLQQAPMEYRIVREKQERFRRFLPALGLSNIGLLVRVAGRVTTIGSNYFYIDDGAHCDDGSGFPGVRVISGSFNKPGIGQYVSLTAISSIYFDNGYAYRALLLASQEDWQLLK